MNEMQSVRNKEDHIEIISLRDVQEYEQEQFLLTQRVATFYHTPRYRQFLRELLDCTDIGWAALLDGEIRGMLPAMAKAGPRGLVINSLPFFGSHGGVVGEDPEVRAALWHAWRGLIDGEDVAAATVVGNPFDPKSLDLPLRPIDMFDERISQVTSLPAVDGEAAEGMILARVEGSARRNVTKAFRAGVTVAIENDAIPFLEKAHRAGMAAIGGRAKPAGFFTLLSSHFRPGVDYRLYVARIGGNPVAALLLFYFGDTVEYFVPASDPDLRHVQPMGALLIQAMKDASGLGCRQWNWGGTWMNQDGVYRFKKKWGAQERRYRYLVTVRAKALLDATPSELALGYPWFYVAPYGALRGAKGQ